MTLTPIGKFYIHLTEDDFGELTDEYAEQIIGDSAWDSEAIAPTS